ncbi:MAG: nucleotide exchange factor GrpE, partial [Planctomycetota bacterium]
MATSQTNENEMQPDATGDDAPREETHAPAGDPVGKVGEEGVVVDLESLPAEVQDLVEALRAERDSAVEARQRALADFSNFQRRSMESERRATAGGSAKVVRAILPVLDNFDIALEQAIDTLTIEQIVEGVQLVRDELNNALEGQGVTRIAPDPGDEFDPMKHEAMLQQPSREHPPNSVVQVFQTGYAMGEQVIRAAKVAVSPS